MKLKESQQKRSLLLQAIMARTNKWLELFPLCERLGA